MKSSTQQTKKGLKSGNAILFLVTSIILAGVTVDAAEQLQSVRSENGTHMYQEVSEGVRYLEIENRVDPEESDVLTISLGDGFEKKVKLPNGGDVRPNEFEISYEYDNGYYAIIRSRYQLIVVDVESGNTTDPITVESFTEEFEGSDSQSGQILELRITLEGLSIRFQDFAENRAIFVPFVKFPF